jgi:diacylglycerol kinase (ATP)
VCSSCKVSAFELTPSQILGQTLVLLNPYAAGGKAAALATPLRQWLAQHAPLVVLEIPDSAAQARLLIDALPQASRVVVVGGDGTLNQLLPSLLSGSHTMALVPFGSGNDTARALGLYGLSWQKALAHGFAGAASQIDVGLAELDIDANGQLQTCHVPFISSLTTGFDSSVGLRALNGPKWLRGLPRYLLATVRELVNFRTWRMAVSVDGVPVHSGKALFASTLNTRTFGAGMPAVPHARIDDGQLNLLLAGDISLTQTLLLLPRLLIGKHLNHPKVRTQSFQTMQINAVKPVPVAADGEYLGLSQLVTVRVQAGQLAVVAATA